MCWRFHGSKGLQNDFAIGMISSLWQIPTTIKATEAHESQLEGVINRIVQQNINAKVQPVSSFAWSAILKTVACDDASVSFEEALAKYNGH